MPSVGWQRATEGQPCASEDAGGGGNVALHLVEGTATTTAAALRPCYDDTGAQRDMAMAMKEMGWLALDSKSAVGRKPTGWTRESCVGCCALGSRGGGEGGSEWRRWPPLAPQAIGVVSTRWRCPNNGG